MNSFFRYFLVSIFFAYYVIAIALHYPWFSENLDILHVFNFEKIVKINENMYISTYPNQNQLEIYKKKYSIYRVVVVLNPKIPFSRELVKEEQKACSVLNLQFISIPVSASSDKSIDFILIKNILDKFIEESKTNNEGNILINAYTYDERIQTIERILKLEE